MQQPGESRPRHQSLRMIEANRRNAWRSTSPPPAIEKNSWKLARLRDE